MRKGKNKSGKYTVIRESTEHYICCFVSVRTRVHVCVCVYVCLRDGVTEKQLRVLVLIKEYREEEEEEEEEEQQEEQDCDEEDSYMRTMGRLWDSGNLLCFLLFLSV